MRERSQRALLMFGMLVAIFGATASARADSCRNIHAEFDTTTGTLSGNFGLTGTATFTADSSGTAPATAPAGSSVFSGIFVVTTRRGTLTFRETGMFSSRTGNPAGAVLSSWGETLSGTGVYQGVSGDLYFMGKMEDGALIVEITGALCRP